MKKGLLRNLNVFFIAAVGLFAIIWLNPCKTNRGTKNGHTDTVTVVVYDSFPRIIKQPSNTQIIHDTLLLPGRIDTLKVIQEYYTKNIVRRKYLDSELSVSMVDTVFKNTLLPGALEYKILRPFTQTTITQPDKSKLYVGLNVFGPKLGIGPSLELIKNNKSYEMSVDLIYRSFVVGFKKQIR